MKRTLLIVSLLTTAFLCDTHSVRAQTGHTHQHDPAEKLGQINFTVSCSPIAQRQFNRAVAWLHSFEYEEAEKAFTEVTVTDPRCGMGYWGIAISNYHPLWAPPTAAQLQTAWSAVEKGKAVAAKTQRERDYLAAIEVFYRNSDHLDHRARAFAYSEAMKQLYQRYPSDREAGVFYALTLIATGMMSSDKSYAREKEAAQILNQVMVREPRHPGVTHYLIHSYDFPALAQLALPAARSYAKIAPASAHAQHMPSHIFTRLGLWQEGIKSNLDAKAAAKAFAVRNHMSGAWDEQLHAMDYLAYAYLQGGQDKQARAELDELNRIQKVEPETFKVAYSAAAIPARYALERRRWDEAARLTLPTGSVGVSSGEPYWRTFPWTRFRWAEAHIHFARAIGAARTGDTVAARQNVESLTAIRAALIVAKGDYDWAKQVEIERQVASAWLAYAEGKHDESLRLMRAAADLDDATEKHPVTPGAILPAREQLGELLLEVKQPAVALKEFEASLRSAPNRFHGLYGAARAARLASDQKKAKTYYAKLVELSRHADSKRPEIDEAKTFLAGVNVSPTIPSQESPIQDGALQKDAQLIVSRYIDLLRAAGFKTPFVPSVVVKNTPYLISYSKPDRRVTIPAWGGLSEAERKLFEDSAALSGNRTTGRKLFEDFFNWFFIAHEVSHYLFEELTPPGAADLFEDEKGANEFAVAFWLTRPSDKARLDRLARTARSIQEGLPNPIPKGADPKQYFNENYERLAQNAPAYGYYQFKFVADAIDARARLNFKTMVRAAIKEAGAKSARRRT